MKQEKEYSNEWLARMFGAYMGCECDTTYQNSKGEAIVSKTIGIVNNSVFFEIDLLGNVSIHLSRIKPMLTPLSEISDADAIELAMIISEDKIPWRLVERDIGLISIYDSVRENSIEIFEEERFVKMEYETGKFYTCGWSLSMYDYLRRKGYDCGFMEVPSLIEAGLAVKKTKHGSN